MPSALVTGGSSGIGLAIARMLRDEGYDLTLASRTQEKIEAAAAELGAHAVAADMGKEEDCVRVVAEHRERFGGLDVLVNSAGIGIAGTVESLQTKHIDLQLNINLRGLLLVSREAIPLLKETKGWIINLASIAGHDPDAGADGLRRDEGGGDRADPLAERRARRRRRAGDRDLPGLRRHADGAVVRPRGGGDDQARGLRGDRAHVPAPLAARAHPAGRRRARRLERRRRLGSRASASSA